MKKNHLKEELNSFSQKLYSVLNPQIINDIGKKHSFSQRKSKLQTSDLLCLCSFICSQNASAPLTKLCALLEAYSGVSLSAEGLNQRFNSNAVNVLREIMNAILIKKFNYSFLFKISENSYFNRIRLLDATMFQLDDSFSHIFKGSGGSSNTAGVKIQLEYDLITGQFLNVYPGAGSENDKSYGSYCLEEVEERDLCIRDLGYFDMKDFKQIHNKNAFYVSRIKLNSAVYTKNTSPEVFGNGNRKKHSEYQKLDMEEIMNKLKSGETTEIESVYCGRLEKLPVRLICYRLTKSQLKNRRKKQTLLESKKGIVLSEKSKRLSGLNIYISNIPQEVIPCEQIHDLYSLRWQIEIIFKTWKSIFKIHHCKRIKRERFECHLYGQLISILISTSIMFEMRHLLHKKEGIELSEYKGINIVKTYLKRIWEGIKKSAYEISKILTRLLSLLQKNGRKSHKNRYKTAIDILKALP